MTEENRERMECERLDFDRLLVMLRENAVQRRLQAQEKQKQEKDSALLSAVCTVGLFLTGIANTLLAAFLLQKTYVWFLFSSVKIELPPQFFLGVLWTLSLITFFRLDLDKVANKSSRKMWGVSIAKSLGFLMLWGMLYVYHWLTLAQ